MTPSVVKAQAKVSEKSRLVIEVASAIASGNLASPGINPIDNWSPDTIAKYATNAVLLARAIVDRGIQITSLPKEEQKTALVATTGE